MESTTIHSTYRAPTIGHNGDFGLPDPQRLSRYPFIRSMPCRKRITLVAHDNRKDKMARWALKHKAQLIDHDLYATDNTALVIAEALNAPVFRLPDSPLDRGRQIANRIAESKIDVLISFFGIRWDFRRRTLTRRRF